MTDSGNDATLWAGVAKMHAVQIQSSWPRHHSFDVQTKRVRYEGCNHRRTTGAPLRIPSTSNNVPYYQKVSLTSSSISWEFVEFIAVDVVIVWWTMFRFVCREWHLRECRMMLWIYFLYHTTDLTFRYAHLRMQKWPNSIWSQSTWC